MKKYAALLLLFIFALTVRPAGAFSPAPLNPDFVRWRESVKAEARNSKTAEDGRSVSPVFRKMPPSPKDMSHLKDADFSMFLNEALSDDSRPAARALSLDSASTLPVSYDLREEGRVTPVRHQGPTSLCWAFAANASLESNLLTQGRGVYDLSEYLFGYMSLQDVSEEKPSFSYPAADSDEGINMSAGHYLMTAAFMTRGDGPVFESAAPFPYSWWDLVTHFYRPSDFTQRFVIDGVYVLDFSAPDAIKAALMRYGAVQCGFDFDSAAELPFTLDTESYFHSSTETDGSHSVAIVGWNDGYPKEKFLAENGVMPENDGAWLIKDSYGSGDGGAHGDGYFYISYEESTLSYPVIFIAGDAVAAGEPVYEYDPLGSVNDLDCGSETAWGANVFTAKRGERIRAVSFWANSPGTSYEVTVETGLAEGSPRGTVAASVSGVSSLPGYLRVELPSPVYVGEGEDFSVVLNVTTPGYTAPLAYEYATEGYSEKAVNNPGKSFCSTDGENWESIGELGDLCIKAYGTAGSTGGGGCDAVGGGAALLAAVVFPAAARLRRR